MRLEIEVNGRVRVVTVERQASPASRLRVEVDGERRVIDVRRLDAAMLSIIRLDGVPTSHDVAVTAAGLRGQLDVQLLEGVFRAVVDGRRAPVGGSVAAGGREVVAPMPGRVVHVLVAEGDEVAERQGVVVVEAMKMENALVAPTAGRVAEMRAREGMAVEAGQVLATIDRDDDASG
ncbi:MAG: biotin/lipoyl-containing protein [Vicinamibacterales bacterium]|jgi:biotin carboxyl carrier protein|nr:hypothetical protein [Acidobacteriota bacterium]MDP6374190.1 biotin/lipoyl-containing protein [Vicinamibacterales bacterium]MDP6608154.1 biotin/lipoyl-containing protein [Vicinamibacterales bacterium]HAK56246.1 hypothetical protein [Acidobacteriota bacterium]|tara:strand:+ start:131 stop:661 length:531 start_codon:yes stop_codon:yes gene_type:complete